MADAQAQRLDGPAMQLDDVSNEGEPHAEPALRIPFARLELGERFENALGGR